MHNRYGRLGFDTIFLMPAVCLLVVSSTQAISGEAYENGQLTYAPGQANVRYFGQWVMNEEGWDRYLMYFTANSSVVNGKPSNLTDLTLVDQDQLGLCGDTSTGGVSAYADRIWLTWHFEDGKDPAGWDAPDGQGNTPPLLMLGPDSPTTTNPEGTRLIGDPTVIRVGSTWHMYYEGTTDCLSATANKIYHATAPNWSGPWTKQGAITGLIGNENGSGFSWPTAILDASGDLLLFFTDSSVNLYAAKGLPPSYTAFTMLNYDPSVPNNTPYQTSPGPDPTVPLNPTPVVATSVFINRGHVSRIRDRFRLVYDNFFRNEIRVAYSDDATVFDLSGGEDVVVAPGPGQVNGSDWRSVRTGLPSFLSTKTGGRIYFTAETGDISNPIGVSSIGVTEGISEDVDWE